MLPRESRQPRRREAQRWLESLEAALSARGRRRRRRVVSDDDGLWRDVLAFTWNIQTMAGQPAGSKQTLHETGCR